MQAISLAPVDSLTVTTLVDNVTDMLLVDEGQAARQRPDRLSERARAIP
jgi:hypothetical protein